MKSKASINGHPIHPILITFPIAFFVGTLIADALYLFHRGDDFYLTGFYLNIAGIFAGLIAAIPGIIDYFFTVPPGSSAKKRAAIHGLLNVAIVVMFVISIVMKMNKAPVAAEVILEAAAVAILCVTGYMGGTLVYRNQIGVYNRYADKGVWREAEVSRKNGKIEVATTDELKTDQMKLVHWNRKRIVVAKTEKGYVAFDDRCTHKGGSLAGGTMICGTVQCPWHGSQFNAETGVVKAGPATRKIITYKTEEANGKIYIIL